MLVVKIGGAEGIGIESVCSDVAKLVAAGEQVVVVHGGSALATQLGEDVGYPPRFVTSVSGHSSRYTDKRTLEIFLMATGLLNRQIVAELQRLGVNAAGMSGIDGKTLQAKRKGALRIVENGKRKILRDDYTGSIQTVDPTTLQALLDAGLTPVVAPIALSEAHDPLNVDGDRAAASIAGALKSQDLMILTNVPGLLRAFPDESSRIVNLPASELEDALENVAQGRMKRKVLAAKEALDGGVQRVILCDARVDAPISNGLAGNGTSIQ